MTQHFRLLWLALWLAVISLPGQALAHALQPGFLDIQAVGAGTYTIGWKVPQIAGKPMAIAPVLPDVCTERSPPSLTFVDNAFSARWISVCTGDLAGQTITIDGLANTSTDVLVHFTPQEGASQTLRLTPDATSATIQRDPGFLEVVQAYTLLGIDHILLGIDHILFVLALILLVGGGWKLVKTITAFTLAHSITLSAAALGFVHFPGPPVEATIALSIVFLAHEIAVREPGHPRMAERRPWLVAFAFGLLHGLGFAGALAETGLPPGEIPAALLAFNVGVEIGQLLFVGAVLALFALLRRLFARYANRASVARFAATALIYAIGSIASLWLIERVAAFS